MSHLSFIELSQENLLHNIRSFRAFIHPETKLMAVLKANAYGHGAVECAQILENEVDFFQVDDLLELQRLRTVTQKPVLVLGYVADHELEEAITLNATLAVYDTDRLLALNGLGARHSKTISVHLAFDSLLGREGFMPEQADELLRLLNDLPGVRVEGVYSHFANIEDTSDFSHAQKQIDTFAQVIQAFKQAGHEVMSHISATSGMLAYEKNEKVHDIARIGIGLYGMWPSEELRQKYESSEVSLKPVLRWISHVAQVKTLPIGSTVGYGLSHVTTRPTTIALIPQGYSDGYDRGLSNYGEILIQGSRCKVLGRVAMNMFVADVSHLKEVTREDEVVLLGSQEGEAISAEEVAEKIGTINYEITTRISPLLPRVF
ncbi:MAG: alanine racemase [Patescibacteria group bacterium]|jgi:alanine racemase|nr:alanine racemase [Patescibacteria group bacterium]